MPVRLARLHARLLISIAVGTMLTLGLAMTDWRTATKLLLGWDIGLVLYLALVYQLMLTCGVDEIRRRAAEDDEGALAVLIDRKSTRLNSSHVKISYAVFCLK